MSIIYTPPVGDSIELDVQIYTPPAGDVVNFNLGAVDVVTNEGNFNFKWSLIKYRTGSFLFKWGLEASQKLFNIVSYPLCFMTPAVCEFLFKSAVSGVLDDVNISLDNTGDSGNTVVEIYFKEVLNKTITIPANSSTYNKILSLTSELVKSREQIKIKITSVAVNSSNLVIIVNQKTFNPELKIDNLYNKFDSYSYKISNGLFLDADSWILKLNQPLLSLNSVKAISNFTEIELDATLGDSNYINDCVTVTPEDIFERDKLVVRGLDLNGNEKIIEYPIVYYPTLAEYPDYIKEDSTFYVFNKAKKYSYSWDNINWSNTVDVSNGKIIISPTNIVAGGSTIEGTRTLYIRYHLLSNRYDKYIEDSYSIKYYYSDIDVDIDLGNSALVYNDNILPKKVEVYVDEELVDSVDIVGMVAGCDSITIDADTGILTVVEGSIKTPTDKIDIPETDITVTISDSGSTGFVYSTKILYITSEGVLALEDVDFMNYSDEEVRNYTDQGKISLFLITFLKTSLPTVKISIYQQQYVYTGITIPIYSAYNLKYIVYDYLDRTKEIDVSTEVAYKNDIKFSLLMRKVSDNSEIKNGELHAEEQIVYSIEELPEI